MPPDARLTTLENGLTLVLRADASAPVVSAQAWCRAGSIDEGRLLGAGLSHVLEHMLFKGTTNRPAGRIDQEVQEAGGYMNAYTSFDRTVYYINAPSSGTRVAVDILCDIMQNASIPEDELAKELDVIRREMDMGQDDPGNRSGRRLFETAYTRSPYRHPIIGHLDIFNTLTRADIVGYYREKYAPNNIFFIVVGDIDCDAVEAQIRESFSKTPARPIQHVPYPLEPQQTSPRQVIEEAPVELAHYHYSWHIPDLRHPDVPALDVLATLLGSGRSSRLYREVRQKKCLVNSADAWTYSPGNPGMFGMSVIADPDKFESSQAGVLAELRRMQSTLVSAAELGKARKQFIAGTLASRKTMQGQASDLGGSWMAAHDLQFSERYLKKVQAVTPADLRRVARQYLTEENRTLYALLPKGSRQVTSASVQTSQDIAIQRIQLPNGLRLLIKEDFRLPFVEFRALLKGGVLLESESNNGITQMMSKMLLQGTRTRNEDAISSSIESVGGSISSYGGNNSVGVSAEVMSSDFRLGLDLVADVLLNPSFPAAALERERQIQLAEIKSHRDHLLSLADSLAREGLFGRTGYGLQARGFEGSVSSITAASLKALHRRLIIPQNCVLGIFGSIDAKTIVKEVQRAFGKWRGPAALDWSPTQIAPLREVRRVGEVVDKKQAVLVMGFPGLTIHHPDRFALELVQEALSDTGSRLFTRIRDDLGLAYYVGAHNFLGLEPGYFSFYVGTDPEKAGQVEEELFKEALELAKNGLTDAELKRAKAKLLGQKRIARQELGRLAMTTALDELYGLGYRNIDLEDSSFEAVTADDVRRVCRHILTEQARVISVVKPGSPTP